MVYPGHSAPKPGVYKFGAYYNTEEFPDEQYDDRGLSLANPASDGNPRMHRGDYGIYGVADQEVWQSDDDPDRTLNFFTRLLGQPQSDRNLVTFGANVGLVLTDPLHGRDDDNAGIALGYAQVGDGVAALDKASGEFGSLVPVQNGETFIEATYQYQYAPWCQIQPDIQYVFNPGGGVSNPNSPTQRIPNELVLGTRVNLLF
jgi:porin